MIKLPSIYSLWQQFRNVLFRFPLQSLISFFAVIIWIWTNENPDLKNNDQLYKVLALCNLAFTLSLSANLYAEFNKWESVKNFTLQLSSLIICALLFFILSPELFKADLFRLTLFIFAGHLLVSFSSYSSPSQILEFWHFNKTLFLRFITAVLFSIVLFGGLSIALITIDSLFNYSIRGSVYFNLFIILAVGFNSLFFLAGIPENTENLSQETNSTQLINNKQDTSYPKVLKIFTQYVLIPLLTIYFGILLVYELKIAINSQLPDGMVSVLILGYSVFGILSYLLIYPISTDSGNEWMRQFSKLFFWLMLPLLILLFVAIWVRMSNYGLTELRYLIILMAIWLLGIALYFIIHKSPSIQLIPISLFILTLLATYGPQSAPFLSQKSQQNRLKTYLPKKDKTSASEKISIINYLVDYHGLAALQPFTNRNLANIQTQLLATDSLQKNSYRLKNTLRDSAFTLLAVDSKAVYKRTEYINFRNQEKGLLTKGFDYAFHIQFGNLSEEFDSPFGNIQTHIINNKMLSITINQTDSILFNMHNFKKRLVEKYQSERIAQKNSIKKNDNNNDVLVPDSWMKLEASNANYTAEIHIQNILLNLSENKNILKPTHSISGFVLLSKKTLLAAEP